MGKRIEKKKKEIFDFKPLPMSIDIIYISLPVPNISIYCGLPQTPLSSSTVYDLLILNLLVSVMFWPLE